MDYITVLGETFNTMVFGKKKNICLLTNNITQFNVCI